MCLSSRTLENCCIATRRSIGWSVAATARCVLRGLVMGLSRFFPPSAADPRCARRLPTSSTATRPFLVQKGIYEYSRARAGHYAKVLFREPEFQAAADDVALARLSARARDGWRIGRGRAAPIFATSGAQHSKAQRYCPFQSSTAIRCRPRSAQKPGRSCAANSRTSSS